MKEGCATLMDFKDVFCIKRERDIPLKVFYDLILEMEQLEMVERRYKDSMLRESPSDYMWFLVWTDRYGCKATEPYFHRQSKLSATERMDLYHGQNSSELAAGDYVSESAMNRLARVQYGATDGDNHRAFKDVSTNKPSTGWKSAYARRT